MGSVARVSARVALRIARLGFAALAVTAIVDQFASRSTGSGFEALNFFSFFTIQANLLAIVALVAAALQSGPASRRLDLLRGAAVFALVLTGLVFALLLADVQEDLQLTKPWVDTVLHRVMPLVLAADWLLDPPEHRIAWRSALAWLAFPAAWTTYTLVRGAITGWYPYPFIDPGVHSAGRVAVNCVVIFLGMLVIIGVLVAVGNALRVRRRSEIPLGGTMSR
jgi:hypothetical protein